MSSCSIDMKGFIHDFKCIFCEINPLFGRKVRIDDRFSVLLKRGQCLLLKISPRNVFRNEKFFTPLSLVFYPLGRFLRSPLLVCEVCELVEYAVF